jgi:excisionase family DNA binding protein
MTEKLSYTVKDVSEATGIGRSTLFKYLANGRLKARKTEGKTLVLRADLDQFLASLPTREAAHAA